jgi:hypothetical protein
MDFKGETKVVACCSAAKLEEIGFVESSDGEMTKTVLATSDDEVDTSICVNGDGSISLFPLTDCEDANSEAIGEVVKMVMFGYAKLVEKA